VFDAASCDCVRALLERAQVLDPGACAIVAERAAVHLSRLTRRFDSVRVLTQQRLEAAEQRFGALPAEREAFERGDLNAVRRSLRRLHKSPQTYALVKVGHSALERLRCAREYEAALSEIVASMMLARAQDRVPENAGPYNPLRVASELLLRMRAVSPLYLSTQLKRLDELASMMGLPELPPPPPRPAPARAPRPSSPSPSRVSPKPKPRTRPRPAGSS